MADFLRSLIEFQHRFADEGACFVSGPSALARRVPLPGLRPCQRLGTGDQGLHLGVRRLQQADVGHRRDGDIAAMQLQKQGLGSYKSAWLLCGKLRRAMVAPDRSPLAGLVEIDETAIPFRTKADPPEGGQGRSADGKMLVAAAVVQRRSRSAAARTDRGLLRREPASLHQNQRRGRRHCQDRRLVRYTGAPGVTHDPHVVGPMAAHIVLPWAHRLFAT